MGFSLVPKGFYGRVTDIRPEQLTARGITLLLADLDNTLVPYGVALPTDEVKEWAARLKEAEINLFVLSNNRRANRPRIFSEELGVPFIGHAGKPGVKNFYKAMQQMGVTAKIFALG